MNYERYVQSFVAVFLAFLQSLKISHKLMPLTTSTGEDMELHKTADIEGITSRDAVIVGVEDPEKWMSGLSKILNDDEMNVKGQDANITNPYFFSQMIDGENMQCLAIDINNVDISKFAFWRIKVSEIFCIKWSRDFVDNYINRTHDNADEDDHQRA